MRPADEPPSTGIMLALAFPDRVARNRGNGSFVLANGRGATVDQASALARAPYIAVAELTGTAAQGRILLAAPITQGEIEQHFADQIETADEVSFDRGAMALRARRKKTLHAITLSEAPLALKASAESARVLADGLISVGLDKLPWSKSSKQWRDRVMFLRKAEGDASRTPWPDLSDDALAAQREAWLAPLLYDKISLKELSAGELSDALMTLLPWELRARLEREAPTHFEAPTGTQLAIDYEAEQGPTIAVRLQELFGLNTHPSIAKGAIPLVLELLSPAHRPVQVTRDLPGFWRGSYAAVRSDLRGRYPRHPWPEDPAKRRADAARQTQGNLSGPSSSPAGRERQAPVNTSLILFTKMVARAGFVGRSFLARVVISAGPLIECGVMRNIMIFAAFMIGLGTIMAQVADKMTPAPAAATTTAARKALPAETVAQAGNRSLSIPRDGRGHFETEGRIDGQRIAFMVDTGASVVALNESSAARFGLRPARGDYKATVTTANGTIKAAPTRLAMVDIGGLVVRDVDAMVLPDDALSENLLGLSFLSKLRRFEYANGKMVLEQ